MRYTKELQKNVCADIKYGLTPQQCSEKYNVPVTIILKWANLKQSSQRAKEIALRKYQVEVSEAEADIMTKFSPYFARYLSDSDYLKICSKVSEVLYKLSSEIVKKERDLNPHQDTPDCIDIICGIAGKWSENPFLKNFL